MNRLSQSLANAKESLEEFKRDRRFKKANQQRQQQIDLQVALSKCRGKLEVCQKDYKQIIKASCIAIQEGMNTGMDTLVQQQMLWDASLGYMLVRDAIYSLRTVNTSDSISHAYDMLDEAIGLVTHKKSSFFKKFRAQQDVDKAGFISSSASVRDKEEMLNQFFDALIMSGDIEECIKSAQNPRAVNARRINAFANQETEMDDVARRLRELREQQQEPSYTPVGYDDLTPPED